MKIVLIAFVSVLSSGCCSMKSSRAPQPVEIDMALEAVGRGLALMKKEQMLVSGDERFQTGLMPSELEINFVVSKASTNGGKLFVELSPTADLVKEITGKVGGEYAVETTRNAGNTINIKFKSLLFSTTTKTKDAKTNDVIKVDGLTDPETLKKMYEVLGDKGIQMFSKHPGKTVTE